LATARRPIVSSSDDITGPLIVGCQALFAASMVETSFERKINHSGAVLASEKRLIFMVCPVLDRRQDGNRFHSIHMYRRTAGCRQSLIMKGLV
jgi:hypothetical protein